MNPNDPNAQNQGPLLRRQQGTKTKKRHGNRKDQRFRRKCRARGMQPAEVAALLDRIKSGTTDRSNTIMPNNASDEDHHPSEQQPMETTTMNLNKRKRDTSFQELRSNSTIPKSTSSISMLQPLSKKVKKRVEPATTVSMITENIDTINKIYRRPMYLKRSPWMLFQTLSKRLGCPLPRRDVQRYIQTRLNVLDQKYCLEVDLQLWQSHLEMGQKEHHWPEELQRMSQTEDYDSCHQYLLRHIDDITKAIDQRQRQLTEQSTLCPTLPKSFAEIDHCLKEYVSGQRNYLVTRKNQRLSKFTDDIQAKKLLQTMTACCSTTNESQSIQALLAIREKQTQVWEELLQLEMRVLCKFLSPHFDDLQTFVAPITYVPLNNEQKAIQLNNQRDKMIQEAKRQWLHTTVSTYELRLQEYDQQYHDIFSRLESSLLPSAGITTTSLLSDINQYLLSRTKQLQQHIIDRMPTFQRKLIRHRQSSTSAKNRIGVSPSPYLDLSFNPFTAMEWEYLSLGPSYIRLNQSALRPPKQQKIEIRNEHKDIVSKVHRHLVEYHHVPGAHSIFQEYSKQVLHYFNGCYLTPLPYKDHILAREQARTARSIAHKIKQHKLIIRETDKSNNFYVGSATEFDKKIQKYFTDTDAFMELTDNPYNAILNKVIQLLDYLRSKKRIFKRQYDEMIPDRKIVELAHLYFNPKTHKDGIPVRPIESTIHAPTKGISKFLDKIIRPIFDDKCASTTIIDGGHLIALLKAYVNRGRLKPSTLFCTFDIHNLYTMLPQDEALNILVEFLHFHGYRKVKGISIDTIRKLASVVLKENVFGYEHKIYRQTTGGAMGSSFTLTLANIFMWKWQKELVRQQDITGEFYGRYIDDVFMTWNRSERELRQLLNDANRWHPNIKLDYEISRSLPFLDVLVTNDNGVLSTSVYRKPTAQPYVVPFISDHPRHIFRNIIQTALRRAVRYSSTFEAFNHEQRYIKLMLLYNGYPSSFIDHQFRTFFDEYAYPTSLLGHIENEQQFYLMRQDILGEPTPRQSQVAASAATANIDNDQTEETESMPVGASASIGQKKPTDYGDRLFLHYTHEKRFQSVKRDMHRVYENVFKSTPVMNLKLIVGSRNRRDAKNELVRKRPKRSLLKCKAIKTKYARLLDRRRQAKRIMNTAFTTDPS